MRTLQQAALIFVALGVGLGVGVWWFHPDALPFPRPGKSSASSSERVLLFFTEDNCVWCDRMKRVMKDPAVRKALSRYEVREVRDSNMVQRYNVEAFPTLVVTDGQGRVLAQQRGYQDAHRFTAWLACAE